MFFKKNRLIKTTPFKSEPPLPELSSYSDTKKFWKQSYKNYENSMKMLMFASEEEPWELSQRYFSSTYVPRDTKGYLIADPDRSNPTRSRTERPLQTIMGFEEAIYKSTFGNSPSNNFYVQDNHINHRTAHNYSMSSTNASTYNSMLYDNIYDSEMDYKYSMSTDTDSIYKRSNNSDGYSQYQDNYDKFHSSTSSSNYTNTCENSSENNYHSNSKYYQSPIIHNLTYSLNDKYKSSYDEYNQYENINSITSDDLMNTKTFRSPKNEIQRFFSTKINPKHRNR
ncbi:hypothetical protein PMAC_002466 [Pneumocystis sp. 'macacae']|nr:hypothetical protein PMAC_002466 [Pneumocystis sp. 'macacae']